MILRWQGGQESESVQGYATRFFIPQETVRGHGVGLGERCTATASVRWERHVFQRRQRFLF